MSLVINTNEQATRIHGVYNRNNTMMNAAMTKVATAQKINSARDGAANWAISEKMRERIRANDQANQNVQNDTALLKTAQGGIDNTIDILKTLKERAINAANDSNIQTDRNAIATEVYQLVQQIDDNAAKVKFNGRTLLDGSLGGASSSGNGVTVYEPKGNRAVYGLTGLKVAGTTVGTAKSQTADTTLVSLTDDSANRVFQVGDKVTLSWSQDGNTVSKTTTITTATKISDLGGPGTKVSAIAADAIMTVNSNTAKNATGTSYSAPEAGLYWVGDDKTTVGDMAVSVTRSNGNGGEVRVTEAENAFKITGYQQSYGKAEGSTYVYATTSSAKVNGESGMGTRIADLKADTTVFNTDHSKTAKFEVGGTSITVNGNTTLNELNEQLAKAGINYQVVLANAAGDTIDGVTRGSGAYAGPMTAEHKGLYFVATNGETRKLTISGEFTNMNTLTEMLKPLSSSSSSGSTGLFNNGSGLTFHVGGEADFYMDIGIRSMTSSSLLGSGASSFANMFTTKESARSAISTIDNALQSALNEQTRLGSMESRLGYTSDNIITMNENLEAADSAYRDADIAKEMTNYMKYAVLSQSAQYMLAQAGQNGYQVLNLLNA